MLTRLADVDAVVCFQAADHDFLFPLYWNGFLALDVSCLDAFNQITHRIHGQAVPHSSSDPRMGCFGGMEAVGRAQRSDGIMLEVECRTRLPGR